MLIEKQCPQRNAGCNSKSLARDVAYRTLKREVGYRIQNLPNKKLVAKTNKMLLAKPAKPQILKHDVG